MQDWVRAEARLDNKALNKIRPYTLIYRPWGDDWLCTEIGPRSSYATWLGKDKAMNAIGRQLKTNLHYTKVDDFMVRPYQEVMETGGHWYDHVSTSFPREEGHKPEVVNYQRLVSKLTFPDGEPAISVLVVRTNQLHIDLLPAEMTKLMAQKDLMEGPP